MKDEILLKINGFLESTRYRCIDINVKGERNNKILEIFIDSKEIFTIDELAILNNELSEEFEKELFFKDISKIIVSSPGAERSFKYVWQLIKHIGRMIDVKLKDGNIISGKLLEIRNNEIILEVNRTKKETENIELNFDEIQESKVKLKF